MSTSARRLELLAASLLILPLVLTTASARADEFHYQSIVVGERALGLGGAFTALADDPSASYYNPAGLAYFTVSQLSASLSVYTFDRRIIERGFGSLVGETDLVSDDSPTLPVFVGLAKKFGARDPFGIRRFAFGFSTLIPDERHLVYGVDLQNAGTMVREVLRIDTDDRTLWVGPSLALRLSPRLAVGISAFLSTRSFSHREDHTVITEGVEQPDGSFQNSTLFVRGTSVNLHARHIVLRLGALATVGRHWRFGLMFQPPGIALDASATLTDHTSFADLLADPPQAQFGNERQRVSANSPIPWSLRGGVAYVGGDVFAVALDVSVHGPTGHTSTIGTPQPNPMTGVAPDQGLFFLFDFERELTFNASLGTEMLIEHLVPVRLGLFTNRSAAPAITGPTNEYAAADVDQWGGAVSVGLRSGDYDISIGVAALYGRGDGLRLNGNPTEAQPEFYLPATVEDRTVYFFISGHRRAISRLARDIGHEIF